LASLVNYTVDTGRKENWYHHHHHVVYKVSVSFRGWWKLCHSQVVCKCLKSFVYGSGQGWWCANAWRALFMV